MKIFLTKNVEKIGLAGEILKVADGFAQNFLFPRKLAVQVTPENEAFYTAKIKKGMAVTSTVLGAIAPETTVTDDLVLTADQKTVTITLSKALLAEVPKDTKITFKTNFAEEPV